IPKPVFPHRLRNSFANHLLESSNDTQGVQQLLGHANISSTQSLSQLSDEQRAQFLKLHPRHQRPPET
ncbi:MAG: tyrosine-type recombinase/integrase, partial [Alcaligenaceae bacterium]|nr:tyrosine-type recombinase/integrase [Alcaligenaceae bacterium]